LITDISGATEWFKQGWVVYSNESKMRELGVEKTAFEDGESGAVSHEVAVQMARGARYQSNSDVAISITGIAGPGGATEDKEVGRVHVAVVTEDYFLVRRMDFGENDRLDNKRSFAAFALRLGLEAMDRISSTGESEDQTQSTATDTSELDPSEEEWEGSLSWKEDKKTVAEEISSVDLASLTEWED
tara:strand:+ start:206 stop:766 length:561 start_codon:yes stop_codon:yes gene_type:complete